MKAILISDHANWCALMMNGKKKVEVRKSTALYKATQKLIDEYGYAEFYVYCTKDEWLLYKNKTENKWDVLKLIRGHKLSSSFNGKVLFKFRCYKVEEIYTWFERDSGDSMFYTNDLEYYELEKKSCLSLTELQNYFTKLLEEDKDTVGYAIHISDLEIFDRPKALREFSPYECNEKRCEHCPYYYDDYGEKGCRMQDDENRCALTKAPQSFCYIETGE